MPETSVSLILPLRAVVLTTPQAPPPASLVAQYARLPRSRVERDHAQAESLRNEQLQRELNQTRAEREAWKQGLKVLQRTAQDCESRWATCLDEVREAAVELAHAIASKLVFQQLEEGNFPLTLLVREVLSRLTSPEPATVRLNPEDLAQLQGDASFAAALQTERAVRLVADPKVGRGGCQAAAGEITVVYDLRRQIDEIRRELLSTVNGHAESGH